MTSTYWSFRITLTDRPGGLAEVARAVADLGVNVLDLDVHLLDAGDPTSVESRVADDLVVELPYWIDPTLVELCMLRAGARDVSGRRIDHHELVDRPARLLDVASSLVRTGATDDDVAAALRAVVTCERVWLGPARGFAAEGLAGSALGAQTPVVGREWVKSLGATSAAPWVVAVPWGHGQVAVVARRRLGFTATEVARLQALLTLAANVRDAEVRSAA